MANVRFLFGTKEKFDALVEKDLTSLYFITDEATGEVSLYKGSQLYARGNEATQTLSGLMSAEDKTKLDSLSASGELVEFTPSDASITISEDHKIGVALSAVEGNALVLKEDGLFVPVTGAPAGDDATYTIVKATTPDEGMVATYNLQKVVNGETTIVGDTINVPIGEDLVLNSAEFKTVVEDGIPYEGAEIGDPYIELGFNNADKTHIYVPMKGLVDQYLDGDGIKIENNVVSINLGDEKNGLHFVDGSLNLGLATTTTAGALSAVDKVALDKLVALNIPTTYGAPYEVSNKPVGTLVNYNGKEIRVMCPANTAWAVQEVGPTGDASKYYIGFKAYAPSNDVTSFKESLDKTMTDQEMYYFENNDFAGIDENGRKYSIVWLPVATHNEDGSWTYFGANSTAEKFIGWHYCVEWYNGDGLCVASDLIRINLANENTAHSIEPYYMSGYVTTTKLDEALSNVSGNITWEDL